MIKKKKKKININASSEAILRNTFTLESRIYQTKVRRNLAFGEKAYFCILLPIPELVGYRLLVLHEHLISSH